MEQIKEEQRDIDMDLFEKNFGYKTPDKMAQVLFKSRSHGNYYDAATWLKDLFVHFGNKAKKMPEDVNKNSRKEILKIVNKILDFHHLNKLNQSRQGLKILTPSQMLSRLPISLAQLKARNDSEKLRNEIIQLLYSLYK